MKPLGTTLILMETDHALQHDPRLTLTISSPATLVTAVRMEGRRRMLCLQCSRPCRSTVGWGGGGEGRGGEGEGHHRQTGYSNRLPLYYLLDSAE